MKHYKERIPSLQSASKEFGASDIVLDLQTEGRFWRTSRITGLYLIYMEESAPVEEVFLPERESDEYDLLVEAAKRLEGPGALISYNGDSFALPHLRKKYEAYRLPVPFSRRTSVDLYQKLRLIPKLFALPSRKLAALTSFLTNANCRAAEAPEKPASSQDSSPTLPANAVFQKSGYSSDDARHIAENLSDSQDSHPTLPANAASPASGVFSDDARRIFAALSFLPVLRFLEGGFLVDAAIRESENALRLFLQPGDPLPFPFSMTFENISLEAGETKASLLLPVENGSIRFYYPDYKNYDYLPAEGYAIHKSVSAFVSKERKQPAAPETCFVPVAVTTLLEDPKRQKTAAKNAISLITQRN